MQAVFVISAYLRETGFYWTDENGKRDTEKLQGFLLPGCRGTRQGYLPHNYLFGTISNSLKVVRSFYLRANHRSCQGRKLRMTGDVYAGLLRIWKTFFGQSDSS